MIPTDLMPTELDLLRVCRDHWKSAFEHERQEVIRLRELLHKFHGDDCVCRDCQLVNSHANEPVLTEKGAET